MWIWIVFTFLELKNTCKARIKDEEIVYNFVYVLHYDFQCANLVTRSTNLNVFAFVMSIYFNLVWHNYWLYIDEIVVFL